LEQLQNYDFGLVVALMLVFQAGFSKITFNSFAMSFDIGSMAFWEAFQISMPTKLEVVDPEGYRTTTSLELTK